MSKVLPQAIEDRPELNLRLGIKSSLSGWKPLIASTYLFSQYWKETGDRVYAKEVKVSGKTALDVSDGLSTWITANWSDIPNVLALVKCCSLYTAQIEHLQVGLGLFLKLAEVRFCDTGKADSAERTGGERFAKSLSFGSNIEILSNLIRERSEADRKQFIGKWLADQEDAFGSVIKEVLVTFTEECQFKLRTSGGELVFMQDGIYDGLKNPSDTVESSDSSEPVGPFRILKSYVKEGMHPYLTDSSDGFKVKSNAHDFMSYAEMVKTALKLIPKRTTVYHEIPIQTSSVTPVIVAADVWQRITYGAPGTGKSFSTDRETKGRATFRTTFHPDTDYSAFVGSYKPTKEVDPFETVVNVGKYKDGKISKEEELIRKSEISYDFVPQAFIRAYVAAWKKYAARLAAGGALTDDDRVYLVIEEINRGHCAQIFGDLFQLLDRNEAGFSDYPIDADVDLAKWLHAQFAVDDFGDDFKAIKGYEEDGKLVLKLCLPPNLFIRATMNTSDQSLFPMDSAFKRRWDWWYVPISEPDKDDEPDFNKRKVLCKLGGENKVERRFDWWEFLKVINAAILNATKSEDKQLGYFFVKVPNNPGEISAEKFAGKVLFYLYNDVFKDYNYPDAVFAKKNQPAGGPKVKYSFKEFFDAKGQAKDAMVAEFLENLGIPSEDKQLPA